MKSIGYCCFFLLIFFVALTAFSIHSGAKQKTATKNFSAVRDGKNSFAATLENSPVRYHSAAIQNSELVIVKRPTDGGVKETIPARFQTKYLKWKNELLATEFGRQQWEKYAANKNFVLTITVSNDEKQGAGTGKYEWDETGTLVGATITLGDKIDKGYPDPIYFPVMNSLSLAAPPLVSGEILAAAKFAHEFGHVNQTARTNAEIFQRQNKLMPAYNSILLGNGYNTRDRKLLELVEQMGGTPVSIWEDREYWGETNAMNFLVERIGKQEVYCAVINRLKNNINLYAKDYEERFNEIEKANTSPLECRK